MGAGVKKDDIVQVMSGDDRGKQGRVLKVAPKEGRVWVEHVNMVKRHRKPRSLQQQGGILEKEGPIHISNVRLVSRGGLAAEDLS